MLQRQRIDLVCIVSFIFDWLFIVSFISDWSFIVSFFIGVLLIQMRELSHRVHTKPGFISKILNFPLILILCTYTATPPFVNQTITAPTVNNHAITRD